MSKIELLISTLNLFLLTHSISVNAQLHPSHCSEQRPGSQGLSFFLSQSTSNPSASHLGSTFKPYPEPSHFSPFLLLSCPFHTWILRIAQFLLLTSYGPFSTQQTGWSFKHLRPIMSSLSSKPSNCFTCHSEQSSSSYNGLMTSTRPVLLASTLPFWSLPYLPLDFSTNGLLFIPWLYQTWCHLTFFTVAVPSNPNPLSPDTHVASSNLCTMPSSHWEPPDYSPKTATCSTCTS